MALRTADDEKSRIDEGYERGLNAGGDAYVGAGLDQLEALANDEKEHEKINKDKVADSESNPSSSINYTGGSQTKSGKSGSRLDSAKMFLKKKGGIIGIVSILGIGGIGVGIFGPGSLMISIMQNLTGTNDSTSRSMNARARHVFTRLVNNPGDDGGLCSAKMTIKCKNSRISKSGLRKLEKIGITALDSSGNPIDIKGRGRPAGGNPASYRVAGSSTPIPANQLASHLAQNNPKLGAKVFGRMGVLNMRAKNLAGKHMKKLRDAWRIKRDGGVANGKHDAAADRETRKNSAREGVKNKLASADTGSEDAVKKKVTEKVGRKLGGAKLGGAIYTATYAGCLATKVPTLIAGGVAAIQLARIAPIAMEFLLSPGAKVTGSGVDTENAATGIDSEVAGALVTDKTVDDDGKMRSAVDSPLLLSALGINKNKPNPDTYGKYIPGYSILTNELFKGAREVQKAAAPACAVIMSPVTMYAALAVTAAVSAASGGLGALLNLAAQMAVSLAAGPLIEAAVGEILKAVLESIAGQDIIGSLQGVQLGHALGGSAIALFAGMGMARHLPTLSVNQLSSYKNVVDNEIALERQYDLASLSPFDTSSPYTFFGSMVSSLRTNAIASGGYSGGIASLLGSVLRTPFSSVTQNTMAAEGFNASMCDYAETFDLVPGEENGKTPPTPGVNIMGLPCTGITEQQAGMSPEEAEAVLAEKGWIDLDKEISEDATIDDLVSNGVIKRDTPLVAFIESCGDPTTGDYLFETAGCVVPEQVTSGLATGNTGQLGCYETTDDDGEATSECVTNEGAADIPAGVDDTAAYQAMSVWLIDYQVSAAINGDDDEAPSSSQTPTGDFVYYHQYDPRWANTPYGTSDIETSGCGPTSMAMILASLIDPSITPPDVAANAGEQGDGTVYAGNLVAGIRSKWGDKVNVEMSFDVDTVYEFVKSGKGMAYMNGGTGWPYCANGCGHIVAMMEVGADGKALIHDPWGGRTLGGVMNPEKSWHTKETIAAHTDNVMIMVSKK